MTEKIRIIAARDPSQSDLVEALRLLAKWRATLLANTIRHRRGPVVGHGPFRGMIYDTPASEGGYLPRRLGAYEASLAPVVEDIVARAYPLILDIGAAEGYYAVGLARRMPDARVLAFDSNPEARRLCAALAEVNGVADRITIGGEIDHAGLAVIGDGPTLLLCDIEGAEDKLLDPVRVPSLARADILVEVHEEMAVGLTGRLAARFAATHRVTRLDRRLDGTAIEGFGDGLSDLDRLLLLWEWRQAPTPWLWMTRRN